MHGTRTTRIFALAKWTLGLSLAWFATHTTLSLFDGLTDDPGPADLAVVFGNRVRTDGIPGPTLRVRLDKALALYEAGAVSHILVSGGKGREGFEEADVMFEDLVARGVPARDVFVDLEGYDTLATARATERISRERGFVSVVVVTSYFHVPRAKMALRRAGVNDVRGAHARVRFDARDAYSIFREFFAWYDYRFLREFEITPARETPISQGRYHPRP